MTSVRQDVLDELRVAGVVVQAARVHEQMADVDRVGVVAAAAEQFERRRCEMVGDRVVEAEAALLGEPEDRRGRECLGDARDPEAGFRIQRRARPERGVAGAPRPVDARRDDRERDPGVGGVRGREGVRRRREPGRDRCLGRRGVRAACEREHCDQRGERAAPRRKPLGPCGRVPAAVAAGRR